MIIALIFVLQDVPQTPHSPKMPPGILNDILRSKYMNHFCGVPEEVGVSCVRDSAMMCGRRCGSCAPRTRVDPPSQQAYPEGGSGAMMGRRVWHGEPGEQCVLLAYCQRT